MKKPVTTALVILAAIVCLILLPGCAGYGHTGIKPPLITQVAACALLDRLPQSAGYLTAAGEEFRLLARQGTNAPTPAEVRAALASLPNAKLSPAIQTALWAATFTAYDWSYSRAQTNADFASLRYALAEIGDSLIAAVRTCGPQAGTYPPGAQSRPAPPVIDEQGLYDLAKTIGKQLRP